MGVATALMDHIKKDAKEKGLTKIELDMWEFNEGTLKFYEKSDFKAFRRFMELPVGKGDKE